MRVTANRLRTGCLLEHCRHPPTERGATTVAEDCDAGRHLGRCRRRRGRTALAGWPAYSGSWRRGRTMGRGTVVRAGEAAYTTGDWWLEAWRASKSKDLERRGNLWCLEKHGPGEATRLWSLEKRRCGGEGLTTTGDMMRAGDCQQGTGGKNGRSRRQREEEQQETAAAQWQRSLIFSSQSKRRRSPERRRSSSRPELCSCRLP